MAFLLSNHKTALLVAGAFLIGVTGTAVFMSRHRSVPSASSAPPPAHAAEMDKDAAKPAEEAGRIRLEPAAEKNAGIRVQTVRLSNIRDALTIPGTVETNPNRVAKITPPVGGKIIQIAVNLGDSVRGGQPLATLDSFEVAQAQSAIRQAEAEMRQADARLQTVQEDVRQARIGVGQAQVEVAQAHDRENSAGIELRRQQALAKAGAFSQSPLQAAQSERSQAESELLQAQTELQHRASLLQRANDLFKVGIVSRKEQEQAQTDHRLSQIRVEQAQARLAIAKQALDREQKVFQGDLLSQQAVQTAEAEVRAVQGDVQKAEQGVLRARQEVRHAEAETQTARTVREGAHNAVASARANLNALAGINPVEPGGRITLFAPLAGRITQRTVTLGEAVERSSTLFVLENLNTVMVQANVAEKDVARVRTGMPIEVTVASYPQERFSGVVQTIADRMDEKTRTLPIRCQVNNPAGKLRPQMFANVALGVGARRQSLMVPLAALTEEGNEHFVYVKEEGGYERRSVQIGHKADRRVEIVSGLKSGDMIVVEGAFVLKSESQKDKLKGDEN